MHEIRINQNSYKSPEIQNHGTKAQEHDTEGRVINNNANHKFPNYFL